MAISLASLKRASVIKPPIMVLYGVPGCGKTTFAAGSPDPVFIAVEDGIGLLDVPNWSVSSYSEIMEAIGSLYTEEHDRRTLVIDTLDWMEPLVQRETMSRNGWDSFDQPYGKGPAAALLVWREFMEGIRALRDEKKMTVVLIAHEKISRFDSPETDPYDTYGLKLHDKAANLVTEQADIVGFVNYRVSIKQTDVGFSKKVSRAVGGAQRVLYLEERPAFLAKNRFGMPSSIDLPSQPEAWRSPENIWAAFSRHLPNPGA